MTGNELVRGAMRLIGALAAGETPTAEEYADGIEAANLMLDSWATERLTIREFTDVSGTMTGAASYTVATGGNFSTTTPARLEYAYYRDTGGNDTALREIDAVRWASIADKDAAGDPEYYLYTPGTLRLWPLPSAGTVRIGSWAPISAITSGATAMTLQPGAAEALKANLAVRLAPEYEREPSVTVLHLAMSTRANLKRSNMRPMLASSDLMPVGGGDIESDT
jgi:hypothetical protein